MPVLHRRRDGTEVASVLICWVATESNHECSKRVFMHIICDCKDPRVSIICQVKRSMDDYTFKPDNPLEV